MPLNWPSVANVGGDLPSEVQQQIKVLLDRWADRIVQLLVTYGLPPTASPLFRPWNFFVGLDAEKVNVVFTPSEGGMAMMRWIDQSAQVVDPADFVGSIRAELGQTACAWVSLPRAALDGVHVDASIEAAAMQHFNEVERQHRLGKLGDLSGLSHLEPFLRVFLEDHPEPSRNVFLMMRFQDTDQLNEIHQAVRSSLNERGSDAVRADDRDYTGELWSNVEVCMTGCRLAIAVFEDIDQRDFNPNVSLELGYMLGRRKRCLLLKEQRLPEMPADVIHRLYKPFDAFNIADTIRSQIIRWIDVDLGGLPLG